MDLSPSETSEHKHTHRHRHKHRHRSKPIIPMLKVEESKDNFEFSKSKATLINTAINSMIIFVLAFYIIDFLTQLIASYIAYSYDIHSVVKFSGIEFLEKEKSIKWTTLSVFMIYMGPLIIMTLLGFVWKWIITKSNLDELIFRGAPKILRWKNSFHENPFIGKVFYMWLFFHAVSNLFTSLAVEIFSDKELGFWVSYLEIAKSIKIVLSTFFLIILAYIGKSSLKLVLRTSLYKKLIVPSGRPYFILFQLAIPWFLGTICIWILKLPNFEVSTSILGLFGMGSLFVLMLYKTKPNLKITIYKSDKSLDFVSFKWLAFMIGTFVTYRFILPLIFNR